MGQVTATIPVDIGPVTPVATCMAMEAAITAAGLAPQDTAGAAAGMVVGQAVAVTLVVAVVAGSAEEAVDTAAVDTGEPTWKNGTTNHWCSRGLMNHSEKDIADLRKRVAQLKDQARELRERLANREISDAAARVQAIHLEEELIQAEKQESKLRQQKAQ